MAGMRLQLDPTSMVSSAAQAESALERVGREALQAEASLDRLGARGGASVQRMGVAAQATSGVMGRFGPQMQQVGFQVGDFATQVGAGTSAAQALGQQLPQLLGGFGAVGAIIGAVAAIAIPLGAALWNMESGAVSLEDAMGDLTDASDAYVDSVARSKMSMIDLRAEFGANAEQAQALLQIMRDMAGFEFSDKLAAAGASLSGSLGGINGILASVDAASAVMSGPLRADGVALLKTAMEDLNAQFGIGVVEAQRISTAMDALATANGPAEVAAAAQELLAAIKATADESGRIPAELLPAAQTVANIAMEALRLAGAIGSGADEAARLGGNLLAALSLKNQVSAQTNSGGRGDGMAEMQYRATGRDPRAGKFVYTGPALDAFNNPIVKGGGGSGGGGGGGASEAEKAAKAYDSLLGSLDPIIRADQEFAKAQETVNAALDAGYISAEQAANTISLAREEMDKAKASAEGAAGAWQDMWDAGGSAIDALIAGTGKLSDVLKQALVDMVALITKRALLGSVAGATDSDSLGTIIAKGLFGGFFDNGGAMAIGSVGIVGERGPELVASTSRGAVVTSRTDTAAMRGGGQVEVIGGDLQLSDSGQIFARMQVVARQAAFAAGQAAINETRRNLGGWNQQLNTDGALV